MYFPIWQNFNVTTCRDIKPAAIDHSDTNYKTRTVT